MSFLLIVFSPLVCLYLKFSRKDEKGLTKIENILLDSIKGDECAVCLMDYEIGDNLVHFPCNHKFHFKCGIDWFRKK